MAYPYIEVKSKTYPCMEVKIQNSYFFILYNISKVASGLK